MAEPEAGQVTVWGKGQDQPWVYVLISSINQIIKYNHLRQKKTILLDTVYLYF